MRHVWRTVCAGLIVCLYPGVSVFDHELRAPTEPTFAGVAWEMHATGDFVVPSINGMPYLEKPRLAYAFSCVSCSVAGHVNAGLSAQRSFGIDELL